MNRHERVQAALQGKRVDRVPVSAWGHLYHLENSAQGLADAMLSFQKKYNWDFMKINPRACYHAEGWGFTYRQSGRPGERPEYTGYPLRSVEDWKKLEPLSSNKGALAEHLHAVELIRKGLHGQVPFIMTVFSPLMVASCLANLSSDFQNLTEVSATVKRHYQEDPQAVSKGLSAIAETFADYVRKLVSAGVDGIFYATIWASDLLLTPQEYRKLARPHDMLVLEASIKLPFNMLHVCGNRIHFEAMADYPVHAIHWDMHGELNPNMAEGKTITPCAVAGGVNRKVMSGGTPDEIKVQVRRALIQTRRERLLLAPSCAVAIADTPDTNLLALRAAVEEDT